jgi:hypothetical protein
MTMISKWQVLGAVSGSTSSTDDYTRKLMQNMMTACSIHSYTRCLPFLLETSKELSPAEFLSFLRPSIDRHVLFKWTPQKNKLLSVTTSEQRPKPWNHCFTKPEPEHCLKRTKKKNKKEKENMVGSGWKDQVSASASSPDGQFVFWITNSATKEASETNRI